ncbi:TLC domain-containing protein 2 [Anolis sagrei]|uniref:TLC domain-containing protein 2 n=1 Tax=Anolis sagrei TaxID=38937 RepID=UPI0035215D19
MESMESGVALVGVSAGAFRLLNAGLERLAPSPARGNPWKWRNLWTSLAHSLLSSAGALLGFALHPSMAQDLIEGHPPASHRLLGVSLGYFLQDFVDMASNQTLQQCWELLFHHSVVIVCFGFAFLTGRFVGFAMVALLVEVNSVFLHLRSLLRMAGKAPGAASYRLTRLLNLGTYLVFRISTLAWMTRWLVLHREVVPTGPYALSLVGMSIMMPMNIILFCRLLRSDFLASGQREKDK